MEPVTVLPANSLSLPLIRKPKAPESSIALHGRGGAAPLPRRIDVHDVVVGKRVVGIAAEVGALAHFDARGIVPGGGVPHGAVVAVDAEARIAARLRPQAVNGDVVAVEPDARSRQSARNDGRIAASVGIQGDLEPAGAALADHKAPGEDVSAAKADRVPGPQRSGIDLVERRPGRLRRRPVVGVTAVRAHVIRGALGRRRRGCAAEQSAQEQQDEQRGGGCGLDLHGCTWVFAMYPRFRAPPPAGGPHRHPEGLNAKSGPALSQRTGGPATRDHKCSFLLLDVLYCAIMIANDVSCFTPPALFQRRNYDHA